MSSYKRSYSSYNKSYTKPKTVGFDDSEAEEDTDCDLDSEPGDEEYFELLDGKLDTIISHLDTLTIQYKKLSEAVCKLLKEGECQ